MQAVPVYPPPVHEILAVLVHLRAAALVGSTGPVGLFDDVILRDDPRSLDGCQLRQGLGQVRILGLLPFTALGLVWLLRGLRRRRH
jgi:hypothetical protein